MASTYSSLKIELIGTGEQAGTWGATTNTNLGTAIEQAITGSASITFASADVTLTLTDTNAAQNARALRLNLTGTSGGARNLIVPAITKQYIINNGVTDAVTVKNATGTGIAVPAGKTMVVFNDGTNVVDVTNYATSMTLGTALTSSNGGTGQSTYTAGDILYYASGTSLSKLGIGTNGFVLTSNGSAPQYTNPSTITVGTATTATNVTGGAAGSLVYQSGSNTTTTLPIGTATYFLTSSGSAPQWTQTLGIANGGTGQTSASAAFNALSPVTSTGDLIIGNGVNSSTRLGIGANNYVLTSNGTTASWQPASGGGISTGKAIAMAMIFGF